MGILLVFDLTDERSFNSECAIFIQVDLCHYHVLTLWNHPPTHNPDVRTWHANVEQHASDGVNKILIGNKCDWDDKRVVSEEQARELADELGIDYLETSAKSSIRVDDAFFTLARQIKKRLIDSADKSPTTPTSTSVNVNQKPSEEKSGCC